MFYQTRYPSQQRADFEAYLSDLKCNLKEPRRFEAMRQLAFAPKTASEERLNQVDVPTLVVMGIKDPDWPDPEAKARFIVEALSGELALIEGVGHYPQTEMPGQTTPTILDFLARVGNL